jgi:phosphotransferase system enzyme I (PtsI)
MAPHPVCFRTMDFGADKFDDRIGSTHEPNPVLGMRAIRISFRHQEVFKTQLRAILRASPAGRARIMFPLVTDVGEFRRARRILAEVMDELRSAATPFDETLPVGCMVEVPATALGARNLLREADFISLGTNDLTQYTLAVDRTNPLVSNLFASHHPAVLRLIRMAAEAAREAGKPISACGEMAGSGRYTPLLLGLGVSTLSVAAPRVPDVLESIPRLRLSRCRDLAEAMIQADDAHASEALLEGFLSRLPRRKPRRQA